LSTKIEAFRDVFSFNFFIFSVLLVYPSSSSAVIPAASRFSQQQASRASSGDQLQLLRVRPLLQLQQQWHHRLRIAVAVTCSCRPFARQHSRLAPWKQN
jgi:hypothetical protein